MTLPERADLAQAELGNRPTARRPRNQTRASLVHPAQAGRFVSRFNRAFPRGAGKDDAENSAGTDCSARSRSADCLSRSD